MKLIQFINLGGPINWVLFAIMCFCFCQCLERCIYFFQTRKGSKKDILTIIEKKSQSYENFNSKERHSKIEKDISLYYFEMNRGLWFINFISAAAPSIGLLGTVTGLIGAFSKMASAGSAVNIQDLSGGIWEAMLTTAFGMVISIPSLLFYRTFKRIIEKRMFSLSLFMEEDSVGEKIG